MRNPKWHRDEIILALDLYFKIEPGQIHSNNLKIIELSEVLNKMPIHSNRPIRNKFRNPNGVGLKLSNFLAIDPDYKGRGMKSYSKLDFLLFNEFVNNREGLNRIANLIRSSVLNQELCVELYGIENDGEEVVVKEGEVVFKLHKLRERNSKISKMKKEGYFRENGKLDCEVCSFDFFNRYGEIGKGFIECHHRKPLSELEPDSDTKLSDLALVCSNCHRMLHRQISTLSIEELKKSIIK
ncbi:HNH endonuclease [Mangrovimonas aestuarii]|uniref:HNH endonuclease n=1 Tax=Mangrovimonas aestuarii TaxID=3018443 RepID=UPI002379D4F5|nr:HNH endonuclease [Mangrovimonas aestuarii]